MRLCIASSIVVAFAACTSNGDAVAQIDATWKLETSSHGVMTAACSAATQTAALYSQLVDDNDEPMGAPIVNLFDCSKGSGSSNALIPGTYDEWVVFEDMNLTTPQAQSPSSVQQGSAIALAKDDESFATVAALDGGFFRFEWKLSGASTGDALTCAQASVTSLALTATNVEDSTSSYTQTFDCGDAPTAFALTTAIPTAVYTVAIAAMGATGPLGPSTTLDNEMIDAPMALAPVTELDQVSVEINGM